MPPLSASVAAIACPILTPETVFSATDRVALVPSVKTGALFGGGGGDSGGDGGGAVTVTQSHQVPLPPKATIKAFRQQVYKRCH